MKKYLLIADGKIVGAFYIRKCAEIYAAGKKRYIIQEILL